MNIEDKLQDRIAITRLKAVEHNSIELNNQLVIMEYLQNLGKIIGQNTRQIEFVVDNSM